MNDSLHLLPNEELNLQNKTNEKAKKKKNEWNSRNLVTSLVGTIATNYLHKRKKKIKQI